MVFIHIAWKCHANMSEKHELMNKVMKNMSIEFAAYFYSCQSINQFNKMYHLYNSTTWQTRWSNRVTHIHKENIYLVDLISFLFWSLNYLNYNDNL